MRIRACRTNRSSLRTCLENNGYGDESYGDRHLRPAPFKEAFLFNHYVVLAEWCQNGKWNYCIIGIFHSLYSAKRSYRKRVDMEQAVVNTMGMTVLHDDNTYFHAYVDNEDQLYHSYVKIRKYKIGDYNWVHI